MPDKLLKTVWLGIAILIALLLIANLTVAALVITFIIILLVVVENLINSLKRRLTK